MFNFFFFGQAMRLAGSWFPDLGLRWKHRVLTTGPPGNSPNVQLLLLLLFLNFFGVCLFIYLFMAVLGLRFCARAFSSCGKWGPLFIAVRRPLTVVASLVVEHRLQMHRLSKLWLTGLVAPRHVGSSQTRARTRVPCIGRQIFNHCATREGPQCSIFKDQDVNDILKRFEASNFLYLF